MEPKRSLDSARPLQRYSTGTPAHCSTAWVLALTPLISLAVATKVDLGSNCSRGSSEGFRLWISTPNLKDVQVAIWNVSTGALVHDATYNTDIPAAGVSMGFKCDCRNGAIAAATALEHQNVTIATGHYDWRVMI
jgi:hypothetical protein